MTRSVQLTRLLTSVVISLATCWFVVAYHNASRIRLKFDHPDAQAGGSDFSMFVTTNGAYAYVVPVVAFFVGILVIWRWPNSHVLIETIISILWVLAFVWVALILLVWQMNNVPIFHGMRANYYY